MCKAGPYVTMSSSMSSTQYFGIDSDVYGVIYQPLLGHRLSHMTQLVTSRLAFPVPGFVVRYSPLYICCLRLGPEKFGSVSLKSGP